MSTTHLNQIKELLAGCSETERKELFLLLRHDNPIHELETAWNVTAEVVLEAIHRASDLTQRMFRGVIAEAACKVEVIDKLDGWADVTARGNFPYDFAVQREKKQITIQTKLQRSEKGVPLVTKKSPEQFVVEVQKTRSGEDGEGSSTRPYHFGEFDILAVAMEPSAKRWSEFRFTVGRWLVPRADKSLIKVMQPVSKETNGDWTSSLAECIEWFLSGQQKTISEGEKTAKPKSKETGDNSLPNLFDELKPVSDAP